MPTTTGNWGNTNAYPNLSINIGHLNNSSTNSGDEVIYPPVPDTKPNPYYSWHFTKYASTPRNYYGYNNRFEQLTLGTYTAPYPNLYPNSANPTAWEFDIANIDKILQRAVATAKPCFYNDTSFTYTTQIDFTRSFASVGNSCSTSDHFFLNELPPGDFSPTGDMPPMCVPLPEVCRIADEDGGTNNNSGGNGGFTTGDLCDFRRATTGARHSFTLAFGNSYETRQLICAIIHHIYTQTDGTNRKYGHYIEVKIISDTQPTYTVVVNNPNITGIRFVITRANNVVNVSIIEIGNMGGDPYTTEHKSPHNYQVSFPTRVFFLNTILNIGNGYSLVSEHLTNHRVTDNRTLPTKTQFTIQPTIPANTTKLILESAESDPLVGTDLFNSVRFSRQATPNIFENATRSGTKWEIQNISNYNPIHTLEFVGSHPIESILWTAEYTEDDPPPPPETEEKHHFALTINEGNFGIGKQIHTEIGTITVSSDPIVHNPHTTLRIGNLASIIHPNDIRINQPKRFRYLFLDYPMGKGISGSFGPGFKIEIDELTIDNQPYTTGGIPLPIRNTTYNGTPVFIDIQPTDNPQLLFPHYNWIRQTLMFHKWDGNTNSLVEVENNELITIKLAYFVIYKQH